MEELHRIMDNDTFPRYTQTMPDLLRLSLLAAHGGVYMDISTFILGSIDWITGIARMPSRLVFNRLTPLPKVLMHFSFFMPHPEFWKIDPETKTKTLWLLHNENSFIAAEKGSEFIVDALEEYKKGLETPW